MCNVTLSHPTMSKKIPRLSQEELHPSLAAMLQPRVKRLGYLGEFFKCAAHQPEALLSFLEFTRTPEARLAEQPDGSGFTHGGEADG